jgi:D-alanine-D-alanine ligase
MPPTVIYSRCYTAKLSERRKRRFFVMRIIVLAGGLSTERDVSLSSSAGICRTLIEKGHDAFLLDVYLGLSYDPEHLDEVFTLPGHGLDIVNNISTDEPDIEAVKASRPDKSDCFLGPNVIELCRMADITFLGLHGGEGENGKLQATFDLLGIKYTGPDSLGCAVAMDKGFTKQVFLQTGIDTPKGASLHKNTPDKSLEALELELPVVVKPCSGGSSIGVYIVNTDEEYQSALTSSFQYEDEVVVESYIKGREFACGIIDGEALPPIEIIPKTGFFDYANKYQEGATKEVCPADISPEISAKMKELTVRAYHALKLNVYSRTDFLLDSSDNLYCLEVNTLPGMTAASLLPKEAKAVGIEYGDLCELIIQKSLKARYQ